MFSRIPSEPPLIAPVPSSEARPLWSVMIPVYNCSQYIPEVLQSVLCQGIPEEKMQIEVVDDGSTDADVEAMVASIGKGRVTYYRQLQNVGNLRNFETCLNRSRGKLIHLLHGDDRVQPGYYQKMEELFNQYPEAGAGFCRIRKVDKDGAERTIDFPVMKGEGILENWLVRIAERNHIQYSAITVRRDVYERVGGFYGSNGSEDWEMWARIAQYYPVAYTPECLADYRQHDTSLTSEKDINGETLQDFIRVINIVQSYLPSAERKGVLKRTSKFHGEYCFDLALKSWFQTRNKRLFYAQIKRIFRLYRGNRKMYWQLAKVCKMMILDR